jgi:hypothetical protein
MPAGADCSCGGCLWDEKRSSEKGLRGMFLLMRMFDLVRPTAGEMEAKMNCANCGMEVCQSEMDVAEELCEYMKIRAAVEEMSFNLPFDFFVQAVKYATDVFGVYHDGERLLFDEQEPYEGFFEATYARIRNRR